MSMALRLALVLPLTLLLAAITGCHGTDDATVSSAVKDISVYPAQTGLRGDLNGNGNPDVSDAIGILRIVVGLDPANALADCNGNGNAGVDDAIALLRCVVGIDPWPIDTGPAVGDEMTGGDGQTLVGVPAGSFMMGSEDGYPAERPVHRVTLSGFWIARCEVTNDQYVAFLNDVLPADVSEWLNMADPGCGIRVDGGSYQSKPQLGSHPVVDVTWYGARAYCDHYGYVLPTEAQWEYAAAGPDARVYPWGDTWDVGQCCNSGNNGPFGATTEVGIFPGGASWCGARDMAGNASEWCADWWGEKYYEDSPALNPKGPTEGLARIFRGGSCFYSWFDCRCSNRNARVPEFTFNDFGFRVAQVADGS